MKKAAAALLFFAGVFMVGAQGNTDFIVQGETLVKYRGRDRDVRIPADLHINRIGSRAFSGALVYTVNIPVGVDSIDEQAFAGCSFLKAVSLPNTLSTIGRRAFFNCVLLETINIPRSLRVIEDGAFFNCNSLKIIDMPDTVKSIGRRAFSGCLAMETLQISRRTRVSSDTFMGIPCEITWKD
ncbi:MAG: leucine-rich repeat domain-containing protein [Treponema sp.]|nr:leucine-rich repeat domain-containing protein [Treponema sp.]